MVIFGLFGLYGSLLKNISFDQEYSRTWNFREWFLTLQGDPKQRPPLPGQNEKCSMKTEDSIFKYNLFNNYLELFGSSALTHDPFFEEIKKSQFFPNFCPKMAPKLPWNKQDKKYMMISLWNWTKQSKIMIKPNCYPVSLHFKLFRAAVGDVGDDTKIAQNVQK